MTWFDKIRLYLIYTVAVILIILAVAFSVLRAVLPHATGYVDDLEQALSQQIGLPVTIASMDADMYWLVPRLKLVDVVIYDKGKQRELLQLDEAFFALAFVDSVLQWSPTVGDISLVGADLYIERLTNNRWRIQGVEFGGSADLSDSNSSSELIAAVKNTSFSLLDSDIHWKDYQLRSGQLDFIGANIYIEEFLGFHGLEINLQLPKIYGNSFRLIVETSDDLAHLAQADLDIYLRAESVDIEQWLAVLDVGDLPKLKGLFSGEVWLSRNDNILSQVAMDASIQQLDVVRNKQAGFSLDKVAAKFEWKKTNSGWNFNSSDINLVKQGKAWPELSSISVVQDEADLSLAATYFRAQDLIEVANIVLDDKTLNTLQTYQLNDLAGDFYNLSMIAPDDKTRNIELSTVFENLVFHVPDSEISFHGVDGSLVYINDQAKLELLSETVVMDFGSLFRQPLNVDLLEGHVFVTREDNNWNITAEDFYLLNQDIEVNTRLKMRVNERGGVFADIQSDFRNAIGASMHKYYPVSVMSDDLLAWMDMAITDGYVDSGSFILRGDLAGFPYVKNEGVIQAVFDANYLNLKFLDGWPKLNDASGHLRFHNSSMLITEATGQTYRGKITRTKIHIPNLDQPRLFIEGYGEAPAEDLQQYVWDSGLDEIMGDIMRQFQASGETKLQMSMEIPLNNDDAVLTKGVLQFKDNELYLPIMDYEMNKVSGSLSFEGDQLNAHQVKGLFDGYPVNIDVRSSSVEADGKKVISADKNNGLAETVFYIKGSFPADGLLKKFQWIPEGWFKGTSEWDVAVHFPKIIDEYFMRVKSNSTLEGTAIYLSDAVSKKAAESLPVNFELKAFDNALQIDVKSDNNFTFFATRDDEDIWDFVVDSSLVRGSGRGAEDLNKDSTSSLDLEYIDVLTLFKATKKGTAAMSLPPTFFPSLSFKSKEVVWDDWKFTDARLESSWHSHGMLINSIDFRAPSMQVNARGSWLKSWKHEHESNFKVFVKSDNFGNTLSKLNISQSMKNSEYEATIDWRWFDEPYRFSWETVQGHSHFTMKDGEVKVLDPGAGGRFVGFFNIFKLFNRLTLDFKDVSGEGFVFEFVEGDYEFRDGYALTENVEVKASSADMRLTGRIGMVDKNYDMRMQVEPNTSAAAFTTGALAGGPILGAGLVLINKLFGLEKSVYDEYAITGSWDDPKIEKIGEDNTAEDSNSQ